MKFSFVFKIRQGGPVCPGCASCSTEVPSCWLPFLPCRTMLSGVFCRPYISGVISQRWRRRRAAPAPAPAGAAFLSVTTHPLRRYGGPITSETNRDTEPTVSRPRPICYTRPHLHTAVTSGGVTSHQDGGGAAAAPRSQGLGVGSGSCGRCAIVGIAVSDNKRRASSLEYTPDAHGN